MNCAKLSITISSIAHPLHEIELVLRLIKGGVYMTTLDKQKKGNHKTSDKAEQQETRPR